MTQPPDAIRLTDVVRRLAETHGTDPSRAGAELARAIRAWPTEPTAAEAWVATHLGAPIRTTVAKTIVDPTGRPGTRDIELRVRREDLARAAEGAAHVFLEIPPDIDYLEGYANTTSLRVAPQWIAAVLDQAGIPGLAEPAPAGPTEADWPGWPMEPKKKNAWFEPLTTLAIDLWRVHHRWVTAAEAWRQLRDAPPSGFGIARAPEYDGAAEAVQMGADEPLNKPTFETRWRRWTRPPR